MIAQVLRALLAGNFVCDVSFPTEHNALGDPVIRARVESVLGDLGNRLVRINQEEGAYFMAPKDISASMTNKVKEELRRFRDIYGPAVLLLDMVRQTNSTEIHLSPGKFILLSKVEGLIIESASLESQLNNLAPVIKGFNQRHTIRENCRKLFEHLREDGYVVLANANSEVYKITGKIEYLYAVIEYISEHEAIVAERVDDEVEDEQQTIDGVVDV
ncbi:condensin complex protein MksE [Ralstonia nicotianae]